MKKAVVASFLAFSVSAIVLSGVHVAVAQTPVSLGQQSTDVQMPAAEYADYTAAMGQTDPKAKAAAIEAYLTKYPQSSVKADTLQSLMLTYSAFDPAKTLDAGDRLLQIDPNNLRGLTLEVYFRMNLAQQQTDATAKQAGFDAAAALAQKGLTAASGTAPKGVSADDFEKLKASAIPVFYGAIGTADLNKKDGAGAIEAFKKELASVPEAQTKAPGPQLQDTFSLGSAFYQTTPPDLLSCAFYAARAASFAPEPYKSQMMPLAKFCYRKYHGADDGFDALATMSQATVTPPADIATNIKPAPKPEDIVKTVIETTPDLKTLAVSDKEFILVNGKPEDAAKVWDTIKGTSTTFPDVLVIASTPTSIQVAVSEDAVQGKTADFTFNLKPDDTSAKTPKEIADAKKKADAILAATAVGQKVTLSGTYDSFTPKPIMIVMSDGEVVLPAAPKKPTPVHRAAPAPAKK